MSEEDYKRIFAERLNYYMSLNKKNQMDLMNDLNLSSYTVSSWCTGKKLPRMGKIQMLADYFHIEKSDLLEPENILSRKDRNDITNDLNSILNKLDNGEDGPVRYNGKEIDEDSRILLKGALELGLTQLKLKNKELYDPYKNKK